MNQIRQNRFSQINSHQQRPQSYVCTASNKANQKIKILSKSVQGESMVETKQTYIQQEPKQKPKIKILSSSKNYSNIPYGQVGSFQSQSNNQNNQSNNNWGNQIQHQCNIQEKINQQKIEISLSSQNQGQNWQSKLPQQNSQLEQKEQKNKKNLFVQLHSDSSTLSVLKTQKISTCSHCYQQTTQELIMLQCFHYYHVECLEDYLDKQINIHGQGFCMCNCNKKINQKLIHNHFPNLMKKLLSNQINIIINNNLSSIWLICKKCQLFLCRQKSNLQESTNLFCLYCSKISTFERIK